MRPHPSAVALLGFCLLAGCSHSAQPRSAGEFCMASVQSFSNPEASARGDFAPNVRFADLAITRNSIGYGAAGNRSDEITIADGVIHLARPSGGSFVERERYETGEGGYMVQLVSPESWRPAVTLGSIASLDDLGAAIARTVVGQGCAGPSKLAFKFKVHIQHADWSLDTLPQRGDFVAEAQEAIVVGLYANSDQDKHFVQQGRNIHAHIVLPALGVAGHLKSASFAPGGELALQGS